MLPLACVGAIAGCGATPAGAKLTVGISDDGVGMFSQPNFKSLNLKTARFTIFWNVAVMKNNKAYMNLTRQWLAAAKADGISPLVSFGGNGNHIPSVAEYTTAVKAFMRDFPTVKTFSPWNEPDWIYRPALAKHPTLAAAYFNVLAKYCRHCTVVAGDVYLRADNGLASWVRAYSKGLHYKPAGWAIHPYDDIRSHKTSQLKALESVTRGPIWFDEISGVLRRGHWGFPNQSGTAAAKDERFLFSLPKKFPRITRIYHYQWQGTVDTASTGWDSGLIGPGGVPRPAYWVFANAAHGKLP
jgi:hypothetical protein